MMLSCYSVLLQLKDMKSSTISFSFISYDLYHDTEQILHELLRFVYTIYSESAYAWQLQDRNSLFQCSIVALYQFSFSFIIGYFN